MKQKLKINNNPPLMDEIKKVLKGVNFGSVELYVQNSKVTQMTVRKIVKTKYNIDEEENHTSQESLNKSFSKNDINVKTIKINQNES